MSDTGDTDDTDSLLASDPNGGLDMFIGLSLSELANKHQNILQKMSTQTSEAFSKHSEGKNTSDTSLTQLEELDTSDFFNSKGELDLNAMPDFTDSDVETLDEDIPSDGGSEASFTFENAAQSQQLQSTDSGVKEISTENTEPEVPKDDLSPSRSKESKEDLPPEEIIDEREREIVIDTSKYRHQHQVNPVTASFKTFLDMSFGRTPSFIPRHQNLGRVVDINLMKPTSGWNIPLPNHSTGQVFTRAPNFRTPGGYKPSTEPEEARELSEEQIKEEVLRMYAEDGGNSEKHSSEKASPPKPPKVSFASSVEEITDKDSSAGEVSASSRRKKTDRNQRASKVRFDFANGDRPPEVHEDKPMKRKHVMVSEQEQLGNKSGAGDCGISSSESAVRFSLEENPDALRPKSRAPTKKLTYSTKVVRGKRSADKKKPSGGGFSFGYGQSESELSPIRGFGGSVLNTPEPHSTTSSASFGLADLKTAWREIQDRKLVLENPQSAGVTVATEKESNTPLTDGLHNNQKMPQIGNSPRANGLDPKFVPMLESFAADLGSILEEADINPDEFDRIIDELQIESEMANLRIPTQSDGTEYDQYDGAEPVDETQRQLSDWAKSGAVEYVEKYQDERLRREECEIEIQRLQKELLEIKQRNAVLEGRMKKKDKLLIQINSAWNNISKEWKAHEAMSQAELAKLQKEQIDLKTACKEGKERINQYELELVKTVELADSFKSKIEELNNEKTIAIMKLEEEKQQMEDLISEMDRNVDDLKNEKETALRALTASQRQLDERASVHEKIQADLLFLEEQATQNAQKYQTIVEQKDAAESHLQIVNLRKIEVENQLETLLRELETAKMEKEDLRRDLENKAAIKLKEEGDRLHEYYNKKIQDTVQSANETVAKAETTLISNMQKASLETERKLRECRERHNFEVQQLKSKYESELQKLRKDNLQKHLLITTTARQLTSGEVDRSNAVDRLQTIVSSLPDTSTERTHTERRLGSENSALQTAQNNIQYSKFTQNLTPRDQNQNLETTRSAGLGGLSSNSSRKYGDSEFHRMTRYNKTSTPITASQSFTDTSNQTYPSKDDVLSKASKLCKYFETTNSNLNSIAESRVIGTHRLNGFSVDSVHTNSRGRPSLNNSAVQAVKSVEPILESPVRLPKESQLPVVANPSNPDLDSILNPALKKCLEELVKSYSQRQDVIQVQKESQTSASAPVPSAQVPVQNKPSNLAAVQPTTNVKNLSKRKTEKVIPSSNNTDIALPENDISSSSRSSNVNSKGGDKDPSKDKTVGSGSKRPWK